jgi:HAMP domain-containing protein
MTEGRPADAAPAVPRPSALRTFLRNRGLRSRLMLFTALSVLLPTLVTGGVVVVTFRRALVELSLREQTETSRRLAERVSAFVEGARRVLATVASKDLDPPSPGAKRNFPARNALKDFLALSPGVMEAALVGPDGKERVKVVRRDGRLIEARDLAGRGDREEVRRALAGRAAVGNVFFTMRDRYPQFFLAVPLGRGRGALLARLSLDALTRLVQEASEGRSGKAWIVDKQGLLIAHPERQRVLAHEKRAGAPVVREFIESPESFVDGGRVAQDGDGPPLLISAHKVPGAPWLVMVQSPLKAAMTPLVSAARRSALGAGAAGLVFLLVGLWLAYRILNPLRLLQEGVGHIAQGKLSHRLDIHTGDEIETLSTEFNGMAGGPASSAAWTTS